MENGRPRLLNGLEGKLTSSKWAKLAKCSQDTVLRDIEDIIMKNVLTNEAAVAVALRILW